ncbi:hypothetical protein EAS64_30660 [Trebonia kvetii]|uniref:Uncharacterized protein n=1 Tax=Trebonia kvetii TaxID=2480626 RepID=A0A6P2BXA8_9ACTN|nr:hypothetical protein [Trebonia kvetii]TVZ01813.1 hypothetical protein EAS64_30660 [Trebonia kvetii]
MTWQLTADWASTLAAFLLTIGTGAQAQANLIEYRDLRQVASKAAKQELRKWFYINLSETRKNHVHAGLLLPAVVLALIIIAILQMPRRMIKLQGVEEGGKEAARILQVARLTTVWFIIFIGSLLALAATCIQLALVSRVIEDFAGCRLGLCRARS